MGKTYTVEEVAQLTGLTSRTIRNYLKDGKLKGKKVGAQWRFSEANVNALYEDRGGSEEDAAFEKDRQIAELEAEKLKDSYKLQSLEERIKEAENRVRETMLAEINGQTANGQAVSIGQGAADGQAAAAFAPENALVIEKTAKNKFMTDFFEKEKKEEPQICAIVDFVLTEKVTTKSILWKMMSAANAYSEEDRPNYSYEEINDKKGVRFYITGKIDKVGEMLTYM